ncbi:MAG: hypothetical protein ACXWYS_00040 [Gaiellaceae bacterium]
MAELVIERRFRGPRESGNGGYTAGRVAALVGGSAVEVTLRLPPPLDRPFEVVCAGEGVELRDGEALVAEARPASVDVEPPRRVTVPEALAAEARYPGVEEHAFPECFVCGPAREPGDGLVLRPGPVDGVVATTWRPDAGLGGGDGRVRTEFVWAALDCPGAFAVELAGRGIRVLGRLTARVDRVPEVGETYVVVGWPLGGEGRRQEAGTALLDQEGDVLAVARATWIEPRRD